MMIEMEDLEDNEYFCVKCFKAHDNKYYPHKKYNIENFFEKIEEIEDLKKEIDFLKRINKYTIWYLDRYHPYFTKKTVKKIREKCDKK